MDKELIRICEQFVENRKRVERVFPMSSGQIHCMCALLLSLDDCDADLAALRKAKRFLRTHTAPISTFRGFGMSAIATKLSVREEGEEWFGVAKENLAVLKKAGFPATDYLCLAAMLMIKCHDRAEEVAKAAMEVYRDMSHAHRVLTANEDVCFAVLYAMYTDTSLSLKNTEIAFGSLENTFGAINPVQMSSQVIGLLGTDPMETAGKTAWLYRKLREEVIRAKTHTELPVLAFLVSSEKADETASGNIVEIMQYLRRQKGYSVLTLGRYQRLLFASCIEAVYELNKEREAENYRQKRDTLQCVMLLTVLLSVVQSIAATGR